MSWQTEILVWCFSSRSQWVCARRHYTQWQQILMVWWGGLALCYVLLLFTLSKLLQPCSKKLVNRKWTRGFENLCSCWICWGNKKKVMLKWSIYRNIMWLIRLTGTEVHQSATISDRETMILGPSVCSSFSSQSRWNIIVVGRRNIYTHQKEFPFESWSFEGSEIPDST